MARAKRTARAEARRRYRNEVDPSLEAAPDAGGAESSRPVSGQAASATAGPVRMGIVEAFRRSFRPLDLRSDLGALPQLLRSRALLIPMALTVGATAAFYVTQGADIVTKFVFAYFIQTPAIGGVFLAGFLATRASWLLGVIVGLVSAACYAFLILTVFSAVVAAAPTPGLAQDVILSGFVLSPVMGALFASGAAWYRRFLALSNPNRGRRGGGGGVPRRGADGRSRAANQKAAARR